jgi:hypothetical protein
VIQLAEQFESKHMVQELITQTEDDHKKMAGIPSIKQGRFCDQ